MSAGPLLAAGAAAAGVAGAWEALAAVEALSARPSGARSLRWRAPEEKGGSRARQSAGGS